MLNLRLRPGKDDGTIDSAKSKALKTLEITLGTALNSSADLSFKVSREDFVPEKFPFVVILEHSIDGSAYTQPATNSVFIIEKDSDDSKDAGKVATYEGIDFVTWLLQGALIHWHNSSKDGKRTWYEPGNKPASAGWILGGMLTENKNNQTFPALTWGFNNTKDSAGNNWVAGDKSVIAWELTKNLSEVLNQLTDDGMCEWSSTGVRLNMYRMGTMGEDKPDTVIGGRGFSAVPVSTDSTGMYSHIRAIPEGLPWQIYRSNTDLETRFGYRHIVLTQSGIKDVASSKKNAEPYVAAGKVLQRQEGYEWTPSANTAHPFRDFNIGDQITAHSRGGKLLRRVIGIIVKQSGQAPAEVTTMVGDFIKSRAAKLKDRLGSVAVGGAIGGSGSAFPSTPGPSPLAPIAPVGVLVTGNTGEWLSDGSARAIVTVQWAPTTEATDGSEIDVVEYEVWSRTPSGSLTLDTATRDTQVQINSWVPGEHRLVAVRAKSVRGIWSDYSTEFSVTPIIPASIIPKAPVAVAATTNVGSWSAAGPMSTIGLTITPVTESTDGTPVTIKEYEIWVDGNPVMRTPTSSATLTQPAGAVRDYRARALSTLDVWGDLSPTLTVTGALPPVAVRNPTAPVLTTGAGNAFARWDGVYVSGGTAGAHRVDVEARIGAGAWAVQGTLVGAGQQIITLGGIGDVIAVRLRAYDQLGRLTGTSVEATVTVVGIEIPDLDQSVSDMLADMETDISDALGTANAAQTAAGTAQSAADQAAADALAAANAATAIQSRGNDLITNGNASLGNLNFSTFALEMGDQPVGAQGAFWVGSNAQISKFLDENIQVDPTKTYLASMSVKQVNPGVSSRFYFGLAPYDAFGILISPVNYMERAGTRTTLVHALEPGATSIELASADGWYQDGATAFYRRITFWNYVDDSGKAWEPGTYSRNLSDADLWSEGGISGNTITLRVPYSGPSYPAGTVVGNSSSGGSYMYAPGMANTAATEEWTNYVQTVPFHGVHTDPSLAASTSFPAATASVRVVLLSNYTVSGGVSKQLFANVSLSDVAAAQITANSKGKTIIQSAAPAAADRLPQNLWIDTTGGANTPKRWDGSNWLAVTDKAATDAAAAAVTAKNAADTAQARADSAFTNAAAAATAAGQAQTTANAKNRVWYTNTAPPGTAHKIDDVWFDGANGNRINTWSGSAWVVRQMGTDAIANLAITNALIANLDAAKITTGFIAAARIAALSISTEKLAANAVTAEKILADEAFFNKVFTNELMTGRIAVDMVTPNFGDTINLNGNVSIQPIRDRQDEQDGHIQEAQEAAEVAQTSANDAAASAAENQAALTTLAQGRVLTAEQALAALSNKIDTYDNSFSFESDGLHIRETSGALAEMVLSSAGARLKSDGVTASEWNQGQMIVTQIVAKGGQLGNHLIDGSIPGHTVFRLVT